jgi:hypothetical protein
MVTKGQNWLLTASCTTGHAACRRRIRCSQLAGSLLPQWEAAMKRAVGVLAAWKLLQ